MELYRRNLITCYTNESSVEFRATATEELTGVKRNGTGTAVVFKHGVKVEIRRPTAYFKPGLDFRILVCYSL